MFFIQYIILKKLEERYIKKKIKYLKIWILKLVLGKGIYLLVYMYMYD